MPVGSQPGRIEAGMRRRIVEKTGQLWRRSSCGDGTAVETGQLWGATESQTNQREAGQNTVGRQAHGGARDAGLRA